MTIVALLRRCHRGMGTAPNARWHRRTAFFRCCQVRIVTLVSMQPIHDDKLNIRSSSPRCERAQMPLMPILTFIANFVSVKWKTRLSIDKNRGSMTCPDSSFSKLTLYCFADWPGQWISALASPSTCHWSKDTMTILALEKHRNWHACKCRPK